MSNSLVTIIVPCKNEQATIRFLLEAVYSQTYPRAWIELVIADGLSEDRTRAEIARFSQEFTDLKVIVVDNPRRAIPTALNVALKAAHGEIILRLDAHSVPEPDYVARSVEALQAGKGENIGGVWQIRPRRKGMVAASIAAAAAHPLGVGDALYRYTTQAAYVDTVPFGCFWRRTLEELGGYDETLMTNEDYELNTRIRQRGGRIWLDPSIRSVYFARATFGALAQQYWRYGYWKVQMLRRYPGTLRWRQALPPIFVLSLLGLAVLALFLQLARWALLVEVALYLVVLLAGASRTARRAGDWRLAAGIPVAIALMHLCWGSGFLAGLFHRS
ncbi:MAG TPA: glycosyltransferase family 2 protein [Anaerolineaceae bacterium]|nr:glycosyltransferase family 2 protein [Anaerolineaceae bacterium]